MVASLLYARYRPDKIKQLCHRQKLSRMILENVWYESEQSQDSGFKDPPASRSKEKSPISPKCTTALNNGLIHILAEITLGKYQEQLLHLGKKLETGLYS